MNSAVLLIVAIAAPIGAFDVLYFHLWKFRLYSRPASRGETMTHIVRSLLLAGVLAIVANYEPRGAWFWVVAGGVLLDLLNNVADVALEPASRAALGGLPPLEYLVHVVGASLSSAAGAILIFGGWTLAAAPTELVAVIDVPEALRWNGNVTAVGACALALFEGSLMVGVLLRERQAAPQPS